MSVLDRYERVSDRHRRRARHAHKRLDIQGLRMVAVLTVFADHLWGWPSGGYVGVDVFFVISGFLITGNLLRMAETTGNVSFTAFYWNRVRRIVPAATVTLAMTCVAAVLIFQPFRAKQVGLDAFYAFIFMSNWRFAIQGTDYFSQGIAVSPIRHFWSLSIEEQFYFVWPALIFAIGVLVARKAWPHSRRMFIAGVVMAAVVATSLGWSIFQTATAPAWAYFDTFARVWELGAGALLATSTGLLATIPQAVKPILSWVGLGLIATSLLLLHDATVGFPAPWALLPVVGSGLVIAAGVGREPRYQDFLRNPISTYIGDISYSLYLVHWPIIVFAGSLMEPGVYYSVVVVALSFALAITSYHCVEDPLRRVNSAKIRQTVRDVRRGRYSPARSSQAMMTAAVGLLTVATLAILMQPVRPSAAPPDLATADNPLTQSGGHQLGPLVTALQNDIVAALKAEQWPQFAPPADTIINGDIAEADVKACGAPTSDKPCTWGDPAAHTHAVLIGDSIAMSYLGPLHDIANTTGSQIQVHNEAEYFCYFIDAAITGQDEKLADACPARKQRAVNYINANKPDVVFISHSYGAKQIAGTDRNITAQEWAQSMRKFIDSFRGSVKKIVFLAPPPADIVMSKCYGVAANKPPDCVGKVLEGWHQMAEAERDLATAISGTWVDPRLWFCFEERCPSFVDTIITKADWAHMSPPYAKHITPVIDESLRAAGIY
ncbi:acyltransferase [Mycobacterium sp. NBC_00419]|uniref:acyltransferase family protein n=1 Tax=Mycobacterium sp. NBC_00419 TaxID=2975989 RepID=UPI002E211D2D